MYRHVNVSDGVRERGRGQDMPLPITGQYSGRVICLYQSKASIHLSPTAQVAGAYTSAHSLSLSLSLQLSSLSVLTDKLL